MHKQTTLKLIEYRGKERHKNGFSIMYVHNVLEQGHIVIIRSSKKSKKEKADLDFACI